MPRLTEEEVYDIAEELGINDITQMAVLIEFANEVADRSDVIFESLSICMGTEDAEYVELEDDAEEDAEEDDEFGFDDWEDEDFKEDNW